MTYSGKDILVAWKGRWQLMLVLEIMLYAIGPAILAYVVTSKPLVAIGIFAAILILGAAIRKPWRLTLKKVSAFIDERLEAAQFSTGLFLLPEKSLSDLARLQRYRVEMMLNENKRKVKPNVPLERGALVFVLFAILAFSVYLWGGMNTLNSDNIPEKQELIRFQPLDSSNQKNQPPTLEYQQLTIRYPSYTQIPAKSTSDMNVKALEGSTLSWTLKFDRPVDSVFFETSNQKYPMKRNSDSYTKYWSLKEAGFYNFRFTDTDTDTDTEGASYQSELYALEMTKDRRPVIKIPELDSFTTFDAEQEKILDVQASITDDYGIGEVYIIATVSKGEGESVKFREERLLFDTPFDVGSRKQQLKKRLDLDSLKMKPGDELYFYVEAVDSKHPDPNTTRSETYFTVIRDTVSDRFSVESTMGADLMPAYFRSQRQLIIDTEKLIADKSQITKLEFNVTSNQLASDQKALRLKYGQFMGDEADSGIQGNQEIHLEDSENGINPLAEYGHNHDGENEHNLIEHEHEHEEGSPDKNQENPLENYLHNHDDPEESTLFTQSLKSKLRQALNEMWDAELHLRLYEPTKSLPYQYRALELIQEIKNSARIYVHRIGFDPPPIKEERRLTGELDDIKSFRKKEDLAKAKDFPFMRRSIARLERLLAGGESVTDNDRALFAKAGNELAVLAVQNPGKYLGTLQQLKWFSDTNSASLENAEEVQRGLLEAIPVATPDPTRSTAATGKIDELFLEELNLND
ncbi:MAG: tryptophan-rich sensory protein [Pricia sp.]